MDKQLLGEYLVQEGKITPKQLQKALELQADSIQGGRMPLIGTVLVKMGAIDERDLTMTLESQERDRRGIVREPVPPVAHTDPRTGDRGPGWSRLDEPDSERK